MKIDAAIIRAVETAKGKICAIRRPHWQKDAFIYLDADMGVEHPFLYYDDEMPKYVPYMPLVDDILADDWEVYFLSGVA